MPSDRKTVKTKKHSQLSQPANVLNVFNNASNAFPSLLVESIATAVKSEAIPDTIKGLLIKNASLKFTNSEYEKALIWYVSRGDDTNVKSMLDKNTETNILDENGNTPLNVAVSKGLYSIFCMLMDQGADANVKDEENDTLLHIAVYNNAENIAEKLMEIQTDIHALDDDCNSAFSIAIGNKMESIVLKLLEKPGIENVIDAANKFGNTPFLLACATKQLDTALKLLSKGVTIDAANTIGDTPLSEACFSGLYEIVSRLITEEKIDVNQVNKNNETPLLCALNGGNTDIAKLLLSLPVCKVETISLLNVTPLIVAVTKGLNEIVDLLMTRSDVTFENSLLLACELGIQNVFDVIIKHNKSSVACYNSKKNTPFLLAMSRCDDVMSKKLLEIGSDPSARNENNETALILAIKAGNSRRDGEKCIKLITAHILDKSIDINNTTVSGVSAIVYSIYLDKKEMLELLLRDYISCINMSRPMGANGYCILHYASMPKEGIKNDKNGLLKLLFTVSNASILASAMEVKCNGGYTPIIYALCYGYKAFVDAAEELFGSEKIIQFIINGLSEHANYDGITESVTKHFGSYSNIGNLDPLRDYVRKYAMSNIVESNKDSNIQHAELMSLVALKHMSSYAKEEDINVRHHKESMIKCLTAAESTMPWLNLVLCCIDNFVTSILELPNYTIEPSVLALLDDFIEKISSNCDLLAPMMTSGKHLMQFSNLLHYICHYSPAASDAGLHAAVKAFYQAINCDDKIVTIDEKMKKYEGNEGGYIKKLCDKYKRNVKESFGSYVGTLLLHNDCDHCMILDPKLGFYCKRVILTNISTKEAQICSPTAKCADCNAYVARNSKGATMTFDQAVGKFHCYTAAGCTSLTPCNDCAQFQSNEVKKSESLSEILPHKLPPIAPEQVTVLARMNRLAFVNVGDMYKMIHAMFKASRGDSLSKCVQVLQLLYLYKDSISASEISEVIALFKAKLVSWDRDDTMSIITAVTDLSKHSEKFKDAASKDFVGYVLKVISHFKFRDSDMALIMVKYLLTQQFDEAFIQQTCLLLANAVDSLPAVTVNIFEKPSVMETVECTAELIHHLTHGLGLQKAAAIYAELNKNKAFISRLEHYTQSQAAPTAQSLPVQSSTFNFGQGTILAQPSAFGGLFVGKGLGQAAASVQQQPALTFGALGATPQNSSPFGATPQNSSPFGGATSSPFGAAPQNPFIDPALTRKIKQDSLPFGAAPQNSLSFGGATSSPFGTAVPLTPTSVSAATSQQPNPFNAATPQVPLLFGTAASQSASSPFGVQPPFAAARPSATSDTMLSSTKFIRKLLASLKQALSSTLAGPSI
jgi:ankyrin repeat protein